MIGRFEPRLPDAAHHTDDRNLYKPSVQYLLAMFAMFEFGAAKFPSSGPSCAIQRNWRSDGWVDQGSDLVAVGKLANRLVTPHYISMNCSKRSADDCHMAYLI